MINGDSGWWFQTWLLLSISYMGCHPKPIDKNIFQRGRSTANQMRFLPTAATGLLHAKKVNLSHNQPRNSNRIAATFRCDLSDQIG